MSCQFKNKEKMFEDSAEKTPHYGLRKLSAGVASVLLSTTLWMSKSAEAHAATETANTQNTVNNDQSNANVKTESGLIVQSSNSDATQSSKSDQTKEKSNSVESAKATDTSANKVKAATDSEKKDSAGAAQTDNTSNSTESKSTDSTSETKVADDSTTAKNTVQKSDATKKSTSTDEAKSKTDADSAKKTDEAEKTAKSDSNTADKSDNAESNNSENKSANTDKQASDTEKATDNSASKTTSVSVVKDNNTGASSVTVIKNDAPTTNTVEVKKLTASTLASLGTSSASFSPNMLFTSLATTNGYTVKKTGINSIEKFDYNFDMDFSANKPTFTSSDPHWSMHDGKNGTPNLVYTYTFNKWDTNIVKGQKIQNQKAGDVTVTIPNAVIGQDGKRHALTITLSNINFQALANQNPKNNSLLNAGKEVTWTVMDFTKNGNIWFKTGGETGGTDDSAYSTVNKGGKLDGRIGTKFDVKMVVQGSTAGSKIPLYFYDLDQPDKMSGKPVKECAYLAKDGGVHQYTERIGFQSGIDDTVYANTDTVVQHQGGTFYGIATSPDNDQGQEKTEFVTLANANGASFHWAASDAGTRVFNSYRKYKITHTFIGADGKAIAAATPKHGTFTGAGGNLKTIFPKNNRSVTISSDPGYYIKRILVNGQQVFSQAAPAAGRTNYQKSWSNAYNGVTQNYAIQTEIEKVPVVTHQKLNHIVKRTIHYVVKGGKVAAPADKVDQLVFSGDKNLSTNAETWDGNKDFADVTSPGIAGYTADRKVVSNKNIAHDAQDIYEVVTYTPDIQKLHVTYHDDTANKDLKTDDVTGESNTVAYKDNNPYTTESSINGYKSQGYELVSDDTGGKQLMLDSDSTKDQYFVVHLKHGTHTAQVGDDVNRTINYIMKDGSKAPAQVKDSIHFNGTQTIDNVTKAVINTTWDANKDFNDITSPAVKGYTPDRKVVSDKNIAHDHADIVENVVYTPDPQKAIVTYIDQTTGEELRTDTMNGVTHGHSGYTTKDKIKNYEDNGYALVSDQTNGNEIIYDDDDAVDQKYFVYLKHTYITVTENTPQKPGTPINPNPNGVKYPSGVDKNSLGRDVNRTIIYKMSDGSKAPDQVKDKLHFTDTKVFDKVTGKMVSEKWSDNQDFKDVNSPAVKGYTPDRKVVSDKNISYSHDDIVENVLYTPDPQKATVIYIDQTTGKTLKTDNLNGVTHGHSGYTTKSNIQNYEDNGYALVSDETKGNEIIYDDDDAVDQKYIVYLKHTYQTIKEGDQIKPGTAINKNPDGVKYPDGVDDASLGHDVKRDITYRMSDGTQAPGPVDSVLHFTATKVIDKVTGEILSTEWSPAQDFDDVESPEIKGYTPDQKVISDKGITHEHSDIHEIVTYDPNPQKATVTYIDATTGKVIHVRNLAGKSNGHSGYTTAEEIQALKNAGYVLVSDETNGNEVVFDDDDSVDQAYVVKLAHRIDDSQEKHTVTRTIRLHNPDGTVKTIKQVAHVQRKVMTDAVTGKKTYGDWTTDNWALFNTPKIKGYTASLDKVIEKLVTGDTKDETVDIYYKKNPEPKKPEKPAETPKAPEEKAPEATPAQTVETPQLPTTGNEKDNAVLAAGTFATGASLLATVLKRRLRGEGK